ncbi:fimbrillin family protein [Bacteroides caecigallinarum]|uniref:fimbrillin family protein n=1 Tax=Bacteroides caecigallinarum TaxID=1411144 RepID=UPI001958A603|nr:fimbrillin family protein [Bacteroides caecigallinarum]MBM6865393.1 fimbrillin family protein [Bacteroides caecigallinarum]MBM6960687.1 fimbrillin family protein [Bacteroides caecigallinarum]MCF2736870.1 fimbrillin family protein [Bacteroides caecigallinarum]MDN0052959.1 fimbrillin family protein [Bacteroides caecigallinarum]MDN0072148.1 fimbrillin family protein [Bacteroides caecigallinarum]
MKKKTCFVMLAALMMAGCSNEVEEQVMDSRRVPLQINGDINMLMTRAADDHWDANDAIGVYMVSADNSIVGGVSNYRYVVIDKDNGNFSPDGEANTAYFPESDDVVNVVAYYPQGNVVENKLSLNLANQDEQPRIDLMSAKAEGASKSNPTINLGFKHRLTKLFFEIEGDVNTDGIYAAIGNQYTDIQYDILNDELLIAEGSEKKEIVMKYWNLDNYRFTEAIVLPNEGNNSAEDRKLTFQLNEKIFDATISNSTKFEAGKKYTYKVKFETTPSGNINVSITGVSIKNWDDGDISDGNIIVPGTLKFDKLYLASGFTDWQLPYEMTKSEDGKTFTWTGNVTGDNQEMKFALLQQSLIGDVQLMPNMNGATNKNVDLGEEMNAYPVIYYDNGTIKRDNKWVITEKGTYTVTVNVETMKVKVEKLDVVYLVGSVLSVAEGENQTNGYDLKRAPYFTKAGDNKYELIINLHEGDFKILSRIEYNNTNYDYYAPGENTLFEIGNSMNVAYRQANDQDYKWQVTEDQTGTYKLTLDVSNSSNVTLTAEKL